MRLTVLSDVPIRCAKSSWLNRRIRRAVEMSCPRRCNARSTGRGNATCAQERFCSEDGMPEPAQLWLKKAIRRYYLNICHSQHQPTPLRMKSQIIMFQRQFNIYSMLFKKKYAGYGIYVLE